MFGNRNFFFSSYSTITVLTTFFGEGEGELYIRFNNYKVIRRLDTFCQTIIPAQIYPKHACLHDICTSTCIQSTLCSLKQFYYVEHIFPIYILMSSDQIIKKYSIQCRLCLQLVLTISFVKRFVCSHLN